MEKSVNFKLTEYCSIAQLKRKFKSYLEEIDYKEFKLNNFPQYLVVSLMIVVEECVTDCLKFLVKNEENGLYVLDDKVLRLMLSETSKYDFLLKYKSKYSSSIRYNDSLFFNLSKYLVNLETKYGEKLMIDAEAKNRLCYYLIALQYEITNLSLMIVKYSNRKTLNKNVLLNCCLFLLDNELKSKIKLKFDSIGCDKEDDEVEDEVDEEVDDDEEEVDEEEVDEEEVDEEEVDDEEDEEEVVEVVKVDVNSLVKPKEKVSKIEKVIETVEKVVKKKYISLQQVPVIKNRR